MNATVAASTVLRRVQRAHRHTVIQEVTAGLGVGAAFGALAGCVSAIWLGTAVGVALCMLGAFAGATRQWRSRSTVRAVAGRLDRQWCLKSLTVSSLVALDRTDTMAQAVVVQAATTLNRRASDLVFPWRRVGGCVIATLALCVAPIMTSVYTRTASSASQIAASQAPLTKASPDPVQGPTASPQSPPTRSARGIKARSRTPNATGPRVGIDPMNVAPDSTGTRAYASAARAQGVGVGDRGEGNGKRGATATPPSDIVLPSRVPRSIEVATPQGGSVIVPSAVPARYRALVAKFLTSPQ